MPIAENTVTGEQEYCWTDAEAPDSVSYVLPLLLPWLDAVPKTALILDAGCGNRATLGPAKGRGWRLYGLDLARSGIAQASRRHPEITFEHLDLTSDLSAHSFGRIAM